MKLFYVMIPIVFGLKFIVNFFDSLIFMATIILGLTNCYASNG